MLARANNFNLITHPNPLNALRIPQQRHHLHAQTRMRARACIDVAALLLERPERLLSVCNAGVGVDVRKFAARCAAADVVA